MGCTTSTIKAIPPTSSQYTTQSCNIAIQTDSDSSIDNIKTIDGLHDTINDLNIELSNITMEYAKCKLNNINNTNTQKKKLTKLRKSNSRLWNNFVKNKYPNIYHHKIENFKH
tara:strand:- start:225 stop:563 length:339 start_codon:yes stop_codon:yes gene_type:complete